MELSSADQALALLELREVSPAWKLTKRVPFAVFFIDSEPIDFVVYLKRHRQPTTLMLDLDRRARLGV